MITQLTEKELALISSLNEPVNLLSDPKPQISPLDIPVTSNTNENVFPNNVVSKQNKEERIDAISNGATIYDGDYKEETKPLRDDKYQSISFESPFDLASFYNPQIRDGAVTLYPWQLDVSDTLASAKPNQLAPFKFSVCACNGSGKDAFVIAPFAIWFALCKVKSRCIITSSSGSQLTAQTETYIKSLAQMINEYHKEEIFRIRQRYIYCNLSGSEIRLFATDEEGKAEGYHPIEAGTEMAIIINEAKSVAPEIFRALRRCTGYNYWIEVSTPGAPIGDFYTHFKRWQEEGNARHVTTFDCPQHLSAQERESDKLELGESSPYYRSKHLALFTSTDIEVIIPPEIIDRNIDLSVKGIIQRKYSHWPKRIGIDLAAGGDENTVYITQGNCIIAKLCFREKDTTLTALRIDMFLKDQGIEKSHPFIFADDGGVGRAIIDQLAGANGMGWTIARVLNQSASSDKKLYQNRGAELWYRVKRIFESNLWFFTSTDIADTKLVTQLGQRFYKQGGMSAKIALESKVDAKAEGRPSPDRADGFMLSLTGLSVSDFIDGIEVDKPKGVPPLSQRQGFKTPGEIISWHNEQIYNQYQTMNGDGSQNFGKAHMSISSILNRRSNKTFNRNN